MLKEINWHLKVLKQIKVLRYFRRNHNKNISISKFSTKVILRAKFQREWKSSVREGLRCKKGFALKKKNRYTGRRSKWNYKLLESFRMCIKVSMNFRLWCDIK